MWLIEEAVVLCKGLLQRMRMAMSGRRNRLGGLHGPMNEENPNGSSPCMLAAQRCNSDVQLPYRLPICEETHSAACKADCLESVDEAAMIQGAQCSQYAQPGYACDYCNKRQPMAFNEVKECCKGHTTLAEKIRALGSQ